MSLSSRSARFLFVLVVLLGSPISALAGDADRLLLLRETAAHGDEVFLKLSDGSAVHGRLVKVSYKETAVLLSSFDPAASRYSKDWYSLDEISRCRVIQISKSPTLPLAGAITLGGLGIVIGLMGPDYSDDGLDLRPLIATGLGVMGGAIGLVTGAVLAPETRTESVLWSD